MPFTISDAEMVMVRRALDDYAVRQSERAEFIRQNGGREGALERAEGKAIAAEALAGRIEEAIYDQALQPQEAV